MRVGVKHYFSRSLCGRLRRQPRKLVYTIYTSRVIFAQSISATTLCCAAVCRAWKNNSGVQFCKSRHVLFTFPLDYRTVRTTNLIKCSTKDNTPGRVYFREDFPQKRGGRTHQKGWPWHTKKGGLETFSRSREDFPKGRRIDKARRLHSTR